MPREQEQAQTAVDCRLEQRDLTENHRSGTVVLPSVHCSVMSHSCTTYLSCANRQRERRMPAQSNQGPLERSLNAISGGRKECGGVRAPHLSVFSRTDTEPQASVVFAEEQKKKTYVYHRSASKTLFGNAAARCYQFVS